MIRPYTYFDQNHGESILMSISNRFHLYGFLTYSNPGMIQSEEGRVFEEVKLEKTLNKKLGQKSQQFFDGIQHGNRYIGGCRLGPWSEYRKLLEHFLLSQLKLEAGFP